MGAKLAGEAGLFFKLLAFGGVRLFCGSICLLQVGARALCGAPGQTRSVPGTGKIEPSRHCSLRLPARGDSCERGSAAGLRSGRGAG